MSVSALPLTTSVRGVEECFHRSKWRMMMESRFGWARSSH
jgi:hypothetical protein